ncbi:MAG: hypothetical protein L3J65_11465, partial [Robiginitomaculum sp.]|nr:hypothetical protein [Robiginitomaculum sp.]
NSNRIASNVALINTNTGLIASNTDMILSNTAEIKNLTKGLAGVAALPDMYLSPNAKWSASGGLGFFGDQIGLGATIAVRGNKNWAFGASIAGAEDTVTGKLQFRYEDF